ncbi:MAG: pantoate--beta-alanine ligase [Dehalococcoidia bacterium]
MDVLKTVSEVRAWRKPCREPIGLVPTMGYLHAGHMSLVERARQENQVVAASIFVNPAQFGPREDLSTYPRSLERDLSLLRAAGVAMVFVPNAGEIYPPDFDTWAEPGAIADRLEGACRPGHFRGVCTVVLKLFNIVQPDRAYFGQKDAQQLRVIRKLVTDLNLPVQVVGMPTVREPDGLAMSSRNAYLDQEQRRAALVLSRALRCAVERWSAGEHCADRLRGFVTQTIATEPAVELEYVSVADGETLEELDDAKSDAVISLAARVGKIRLIDNVDLLAAPLPVASLQGRIDCDRRP